MPIEKLPVKLLKRMKGQKRGATGSRIKSLPRVSPVPRSEKYLKLQSFIMNCKNNKLNLVAEFRKNNLFASVLKSNGFRRRDLLAMDLSPLELKRIGFTIDDYLDDLFEGLREASVDVSSYLSLDELLQQFSVSDIQNCLRLNKILPEITRSGICLELGFDQEYVKQVFKL